ncbi:MAG: recombinase family protein [Hyphomicrobium sp.]|nr:recombinase family protein [Hyphomicrobium sp.]
MSTEHQQYSTANQKRAIGDYAAACGIEIVVTYEDLGKSGLTLAGRPALCQLIADVVSGERPFEIVLVYDVSRWGRFQDADESAHLEYLCKLAGVRVEYCAEPFSNDGSPFASICKVVKRALAAEYSRELSTKVYAGKRRLVELGFRQGGCPGYGLRRCLIDASGERKGLLARGECKSVATDRIILVPGPPEEIAVVQRIYEDYVHNDMGTWSIAHALNLDGIRSESGGRWSEAVVKRILTSEKYVGDSVWGRQSCKLKTEHRNTDPSTWVRYRGAFEPIVSRELFEKAQKVRAKRARRVSDHDVVRRLRRIHAEHGEITTRLIKEDGYLGSGAIRQRFGSLVRAYADAGFSPSRDLALISIDGAARRLRSTIATAVAEGIEAHGGSVERLRGRCRFLINGEITASISVARRHRRDRGIPRWVVKRGGTDDDLTITVILDGHEERPVCYYFFPVTEIGRGLLLAANNPVQVEVFRANGLEPLWHLCARCDPATEWSPAPANGRSRREDAPPVRPLAFKLGRSRSASRKAGAGAFVKTTGALRAAASKADLTAAYISKLRQTLVKLLIDVRFVRVLALQGISSVPSTVFRTGRDRDEHSRAFQEGVRDRAIALISGNALSQKARLLLDRLTPERRIEVAEVMVLTNDFTDCHTLSLVAATPKHQLLQRFGSRANGPSERLRRIMIAEGAYTYREAKRALACSGCDALDGVTLAAFARRLMANPDVGSWLEQHNRKAMGALKSVLRHRFDGADTN